MNLRGWIARPWAGMAVALVMALSAAPAGADDVVRIGVLAKRGPQKCLKKWKPTADYLSEKLGRRVVIQPMKFAAVPVFIKNRKIDFYLVNSSMYCDMQNRFGGEAIVSLINAREGKPLKQFAGVLFVKADSPIQNLEDVRGRRFACVKKTSFGGYQMALRLLKQHGIDPERDCSAFKEAGTHDKVVQMVLKGIAEVGTVRSDTLERMAAEGQLDMSRIRVLNRQDDGFPFVHSTQLYPEWPLARCAHTDGELARAVARALLEMPADSPAAKAARCAGWCQPLDYQPVATCLGELNIGSYGK